MLQGIVGLRLMILWPEQLDAVTERGCKQAWEEAPCPECGLTRLYADLSE